jgi:tetratricopeptide (TPR) repeat protein
MRFICVVFIIFLALTTSAQCHQTIEDGLNKGHDLANQSKYDEAIKAYNKSIELDPNYVVAWNKDNALLSHSTSNATSLDQYLDTCATGLFNFLKIVIILLLLLALIFIIIKIYAQQGVVVLPFEISKNENLSSIAVADQLTAELIQIQKIHNIKNKETILRTSNTNFATNFSSEQSLGNREMIVPKAETLEFSMANIGNISIASNSLSLGNIIIAFKNICPGIKPFTTIRGSLQRYGSAITLVALLEGDNVQSWTVRRAIANNDEKRLHEMIKNLAFMIAYDLSRSTVSARTWEGLKNYTDALDTYRQYKLSGNPDDLYLASNSSLKAISIEKDYKKPFELLSSLEVHMLSIGRQNDAIEYCNRTLELDNASAYGWNNKGTILCALCKYNEAIEAYDKATRLDPNYAAAWNNKGHTLANQSKYDEAIKAYDKAIELDPGYAVAWNNKGYTLDNQGKYDEAIEAYDEAIGLDPKLASARNNKGYTLANQSKYDEAIKTYDKAIELDPNYAAAWNNKGLALNSQGKYDKAIEACDEAIRLDPKLAWAWNNKGLALNSQGKYDKAIEACDEAIRLDPKLAWAWSNKGFALKSLGQVTEAKAAYAKAKELGYVG